MRRLRVQHRLRRRHCGECSALHTAVPCSRPACPKMRGSVCQGCSAASAPFVTAKTGGTWPAFGVSLSLSFWLACLCPRLSAHKSCQPCAGRQSSAMRSGGVRVADHAHRPSAAGGFPTRSQCADEPIRGGRTASYEGVALRATTTLHNINTSNVQYSTSLHGVARRAPALRLPCVRVPEIDPLLLM